MTVSVLVLLSLLTKEVLLQDAADNEYCKISSEHTMCIKPVKGPDCGTSKYLQRIPNDKDKEAILKWHNDVRDRTAAGLEDKTIGNLPSGSDMLKLEWDDELATIAQRHTDQCLFEHDCGECKSVLNGRFEDVSQNLGRIGFANIILLFNFTQIIEPWYKKEVSLFSSELVNNYQFESSYGHYSLVIWGSVQFVGCGGCTYKQDRYTFHYVTCNYGPAGNYLEEPVYTSGTPCSACPTGKTCDDNSTLCA